MGLLGSLFSPNVEKLESNYDIDGLIAALHFRNADVRAKAARALGVLHFRSQVRKAVQPLMELLKDDAAEVREAAAAALGEIGDSTATDLLIPLLQDSNTNVRFASARSLGKLGEAKATESLLKLLDKCDNFGRCVVNNALKRWKSDAGIEQAIVASISVLKERRRLLATEWWQSAAPEMKRCDTCWEQKLSCGQAYLLSSAEVLESEAYIDSAAQSRIWAQGHRVKAVTQALDGLAKRMAEDGIRLMARAGAIAEIRGITNPWLVCNDCLNRYFN